MIQFLFWVYSVISSVLSSTASAEDVCGERKDSSWRWNVRIIDRVPVRDSILCDGTLLNERFVLTVAHCLFDLNGDPLDVRKLWILIADGESMSIERTYYPKPFNVEELDNDLVLIMMDRRVVFNALVAPVCIPDPTRKKLKEVVVPSWESEMLPINDPVTCRTNTEKIFQKTFEGALCLGFFKETHKFIENAGNGLFEYKNGKWFLVGVQMYGTGQTKAQTSYIGAVSLQPYVIWLRGILNYHAAPNLSEKKCEELTLNKSPQAIDRDEAVNLLESERTSSRTLCHGTLISPRFVLTTAKCARKTKRVFISYGANNSEGFNNLKFYYEEWNDKLALIDLQQDKF
ncbi:serine protease 33-like isoform X2 [Topomyia yanbarensis]|uniref:serine protease 33-like isoform X2 n=1 Tax=Topomyia yanbarensis TaxID=2498891 RepID=UPI00273B4B14|nr:serine protease 33-like isoform X2 [Topomyia yanbarensis]